MTHLPPAPRAVATNIFTGIPNPSNIPNLINIPNNIPTSIPNNIPNPNNIPTSGKDTRRNRCTRSIRNSNRHRPSARS
jgi:hypothetical protein